MESFEIGKFVVDLLVVLFAGLLSGVICKRAGVSLLVGYLIIGAVIGEGGLGLVSQGHHELEFLARAGALLLLFSVGIEFSLDELRRMSGHFFVGGAVQMLLVAAPLIIVASLCGMTWKAALLVGAAGALSSTILVFKALHEWGQSDSPHGQRAIGILLFQDVALVPMMLLLPLLTGNGGQALPTEFAWLVLQSLVFIVAVAFVHLAIRRWAVPLLTGLRSVEIVVLFTLATLTGVCYGSYWLGLPPAIGALAAGLMLGGNRLSKQIDTLVLPFRESFAAIFFVSLGTLLQPLELLSEPALLTAGIAGVVLLKSAAAMIALKLTGLSWKSAAGMGMGLAQLGEFSFLLATEAMGNGIISPDNYNRILFVALGTLICTPLLVKFGLKLVDESKASDNLQSRLTNTIPARKAIVIGIGHIGSQIALQIETRGGAACLIDLSPINLHPFAQMGLHTVVGDATNPDVLRRVNIIEANLAVVCVPNDEAAIQIVRTLRELNSQIAILVRCRLLASKLLVERAGANSVVAEEQEVLATMLQQINENFRSSMEPVTQASETSDEFLPLSKQSSTEYSSNSTDLPVADSDGTS